MCVLQYSKIANRKSQMGQCQSLKDKKNVMGRKFSQQKPFNLKNVKTNGNILFQVKTWKNERYVNLAKNEHAAEKELEAIVGPYETVQFDLSEFSNIIENKDNSFVNQFPLKCQVKAEKNSFFINFPEEDESKLIWKFIDEWTQIKNNDSFKIGVTKFTLKNFVGKKKIKTLYEIKTEINAQSEESQSEILSCSTDIRCRVCYDYETQENPMITPCKCKGSVQYIHMGCLCDWIFGLPEAYEESKCFKMKVKKLECEICKSNLSDIMNYDKIADFYVSQHSTFKAPYAIFEGKNKSGDAELISNCFILPFSQKKEFSFGRTPKSDIYLSQDTCISKINSEIKIQRDRIFIRDCGSTHGTKFYINQGFEISSKKQFVQFGYRNMLVNIWFKNYSNKQN